MKWKVKLNSLTEGS